MAIVNSVSKFTGVGNVYASNIGVVILTAAPQTVRVPSAGSISPALSSGYWRMKLYNQTVAISFTTLQINAADGTNLVLIDEMAPGTAIAISATAWVDLMGEFLVDTSTAGGGATGTLIFGGATFFQFLVTTTGAGGTAAGDFEIAGQP